MLWSLRLSGGAYEGHAGRNAQDEADPEFIMRKREAVFSAKQDWRNHDLATCPGRPGLAESVGGHDLTRISRVLESLISQGSGITSQIRSI